jgi:hypothetical protein
LATACCASPRYSAEPGGLVLEWPHRSEHLNDSSAVAHTETSLVFENATADGWQEVLP